MLLLLHQVAEKALRGTFAPKRFADFTLTSFSLEPRLPARSRERRDDLGKLLQLMLEFRRHKASISCPAPKGL